VQPSRGAAALLLDLQRLPATIKVSSNVPNAVVFISGIDVGVAPVEVPRPGGTDSVTVRKRGYVAYSSSVT
jgi:hypothetical protein